jgi:hypothetical protein
MPTFEKDIHHGRLRPVVDSNDIARKAIKKRHLSDEVVEEMNTHVKSVSVNGGLEVLPDEQGNVNIVVGGGSGEGTEELRKQVEQNTEDIKTIKSVHIDEMVEYEGVVSGTVEVEWDAIAAEPEGIYFYNGKFVALASGDYYAEWEPFGDIKAADHYGTYTKEGRMPVADKIYYNKSNSLGYRWGGSALVQVDQSLALGETSSTAYAGDKGLKLDLLTQKHDAVLEALALGAKASCVIEPSVVYKNSEGHEDISVSVALSNVEAENTQLTVYTIKNGNKELSFFEDSKASATQVVGVHPSHDIKFELEALYKGVAFKASAVLYAVGKIFYGAGESASAATNVASPRRTPAGTYSLTTQSGNYVWWLVPSSMSISKATLNGFNFPIKQDGTTSVDGVGYKIYKSENQYSASTMNIVVS